MSLISQDFQRRALRRNRAIATALLAVMAALFITTTLAPQPGFSILLIRATAEAAVVGALADWFAVTAIFRQPLGLPIPHTAIVPKNKDRIGEGLASFLEHNFLTPDLVRERLRSISPARLAADWLSCPANADAAADRLTRLLPYLVSAVDDRDFRQFVGDMLGRQLASLDLGPILGRVVAMLTANGFHETLIDRFLEFCREFLDTRENQFHAAAEAQRRRWWIPKAVNRQIAKVMTGTIRELLSDLREPGSPARRSLIRGIEGLAAELGTSPRYRARLEEAKLRLLSDKEARAWLGSAWKDIEQALLADLAAPEPTIARAFAAGIRSLGQNLAADTAMRERIDHAIEMAAIEIIPWRGKLAQFISDVVRQWDTRSFTERLELAVGRDLQYIRITGTLVGGLVGCLLYLLSAALE
jgi:uncharacterized membrane-anchored protein YjiN (DUF445 family)